MFRWSILILAIVASLLCVWLYWPSAKPEPPAADPQLLNLYQSEVRPVFSKLLESDSMLERIQLAGQLHKSIVNLDDNQRRQLFEIGQRDRDSLGKLLIGREQRRVDVYFKLTREQQIAALDKHIDEMETMGKMFSMMGNKSKGSTPEGPPMRGPGRPPQNEQMRQVFTQKLLNDTTPEFRAQISDYLGQLAQRREERGLPPASPFSL